MANSRCNHALSIVPAGIAAILVLALVPACSASTSGANSVDAATDAASDSAKPGSDTGVSDSAQPDPDYVTLTLDGKPVTATLRQCGDFEDATYRTFAIIADVAGGRTITINYIYGYAGGDPYAPVGRAVKSGGSLSAELAEPGDDKSDPSKFPWNGSITLDLTATGRDGLYEGVAEGTFEPSPISLDPSPPIPYRFAWRHRKTK